MNKLKVFEKELSYIKNKKIKNFTEEIIKELPDYFFTIPASSTGKYHPSYALGEGGLIRHTKAAVGIAKELFEMNNMFNKEEQDLIISTLIIHDGFKKGKEEQKYTVHEHPNLIADFVADKYKELKILTTKQVKTIFLALRSHMGRWNTNKYSKVVLNKPKSKIDRFVHMCDYFASRKCLEFNFEV